MKMNVVVNKLRGGAIEVEIWFVKILHFKIWN